MNSPTPRRGRSRSAIAGEQSPLARRAGGLTVESGSNRLENAVELRHVIVSLVALAALAGLVAGCGGSDATPSTAQSGGSAQPAALSGDSLTIKNFKFTPASIAVSRGARITVTNHDTTAHTATADDGHSFDTGNIDPGSSATLALKTGTYKYHCSIHPFMHGSIVVR
jgi:plastocyanin